MSISSIVQIAERLLNGNLGQDQDNQGKSKPAQKTTQGQNNRTEFGDRFTRSGETADGGAPGETGLLQVEKLRFTAVNIQSAGGNATTAATANTGAGPVAANVTEANAIGTSAAAAGQVGAAHTVATTAVPQNIASTAIAPGVGVAITTAATAGGTPQNTTAAATPSTVQTQQDLQGLNASLSALGLNAAEIAAFDQFASALLQFDPNALQDLQSQLNLLATQFQTQNAPPANASLQPAAGSPGFQLNELSVSFKGVQETVNQGSQSAGTSATATFSAFSLQIKEVSVTLSNPAGQTTQVQSPQAATTLTAKAPVAQAAQAATA